MAQNQNRALSMLSIAAKAGKVQSGGFLTEKAIQEGVAYFVIIAEDASGNTQVLAVTDAGLAKQISDKLD